MKSKSDFVKLGSQAFTDSSFLWIEKNMKKPVVLVTGASRGLGEGLSQRLKSEHYTVYAGMRSPRGLPSDDADGLKAIALDVCDEASMQRAIEEIINKEGSLDVIIHNAGLQYLCPAEAFTVEEIKNLFEVNFFGPFRLTQLALPQMRSQGSGRLVFISSIRGVESCPYMGPYSASKAALEALAFDWAITLDRWNIKVSIIQPGPVRTGVEMKHGTYFDGKENPYSPCPQFPLAWQTIDEVCDVIIQCISAEHPCFRYQTGPAAQEIVEKYLIDAQGNSWVETLKSWWNKASFHN